MSAQRRVKPLRAIPRYGLAPVTVVSANFAAGCVGLFAPLGVAITALGLDWLHFWDVQMPILYGAAALSLVSLSYTAWRHRQPLLLVLGIVSVGGLLYPLHDALNVTVFQVLMNGGAAGLLAAAVWNALLATRAAACTKRDPRPEGKPPSLRSNGDVRDAARANR